MTGLVDPSSPRTQRPRGRRLWRIVRWPLALLLAGILGFLAINAFDEKLSPQTQAMLRTPDNPYSDGQNLYVLLAGISAPAGESMLERGRRNIGEFSAALAAAQPGTYQMQAGSTPKRQAFQVDLGSWDPKPADKSAWDAARHDAVKIAALATQYREILTRYESLQQTTGYVETVRPVPQAPVYSAPRNLRTLYLADVARRIQGGTSQEQARALQSLRQDLDLWQRMLQGEGSLISKMLAQGYIHSDLLLLSDAVADPSVSLQAIAASSGPWLEPRPIDDWKIGKVFAAEFRGVADVFQSIEEEHSLVGKWLFLPRATMNAEAKQLHALQLLADSDPGQMQERSRAMNLELAEAASFPGVLRNPMGKILLRIATPAYHEYPLRAFDVAAVQRAVALAYQIRANHLASADVEAFIQAHPEWSTHPVGNAQFVWNPDTMELQVPQQARTRKIQRFSVRVARINPA